MNDIGNERSKAGIAKRGGEIIRAPWKDSIFFPLFAAFDTFHPQFSRVSRHSNLEFPHLILKDNAIVWPLLIKKLTCGKNQTQEELISNCFSHFALGRLCLNLTSGSSNCAYSSRSRGALKNMLPRPPLSVLIFPLANYLCKKHASSALGMISSCFLNVRHEKNEAPTEHDLSLRQELFFPWQHL